MKDNYYEAMFADLRDKVNFCGEEDWLAFQKWVKTAKHSPWEEASGMRLWNAWWNIQSAKEHEKLKKRFHPKDGKYTCWLCKKKMCEDEFARFDTRFIQGERGQYQVRIGSGICKECAAKSKEERRAASEAHRKELRDLWYQEHREEVLAKQKERKKYNAQKNKEWKAAHREQIAKHERERIQSNPVYKLKHQARNTIYHSFARTGNAKSERCEKIVGLPIDELIYHLKRTYKEVYGKEWDGVEKVHIDHIIPLATATTEEDVLRLCHYTNLRLITAEDNQRKGAKLNYAI